MITFPEADLRHWVVDGAGNVSGSRARAAASGADAAFNDVARLIDDPRVQVFFRESDLFHLKGTAREITDTLLCGGNRAIRALHHKAPRDVWAFAVFRCAVALASVRTVPEARLFEVVQPDAHIRRDGCALQCRLVNIAMGARFTASV